MDGEVITGILLLAFGVVLSAWTVKAIRSDWASTRINVIEAAILKIGDAEPLPKSRLGVAWDRLQTWMCLGLGLAMIGLGLVFLFVE